MKNARSAENKRNHELEAKVLRRRAAGAEKMPPERTEYTYIVRPQLLACASAADDGGAT